MGLDNSLVKTRDLEVGIAGNLIAKCEDIQLGIGQILVLIGKNGSGKSTFLRTLCGLIKPISGTVEFQGRHIHDVPVEKHIAWLSQEEHLEFSWTAKEYVSLGRIAHNSGLSLTKQDREAVEAAITQVDASKFSDRYMNELSGGERQRLRLARALAQDTPLILMDEPTTHLDLEHQIQFLTLTQELAEQGKSIVVSLHDVSQAKLIGTQFLLFQGKSAASVRTKEALTIEQLEGTLGVRFELLNHEAHGELLLPIYLGRTTD